MHPSSRTTSLYVTIGLMIGIPLLVVLAFLVALLVLQAGTHGADDATIGLVLVLPIALVGLVPIALVVSVLRGRKPSLIEIGLVSFAVAVAALAFLNVQGMIALVDAMVSRPGAVQLDWPMAIVTYADGATYNHNLTQPGLWLGIALLVVALAGVVSAVLDAARTLRPAHGNHSSASA